MCSRSPIQPPVQPPEQFPDDSYDHQDRDHYDQSVQGQAMGAHRCLLHHLRTATFTAM